MFEIIFRHRCYSLAIAIILFSNPLCSNENNLIYFRKQLGNKGKCSRFSLVNVYLYLYNLYPTNATYFGSSL